MRALGNEREAEETFRAHVAYLVDRARAGAQELVAEKLGPLVPGERGVAGG